MDEVSSALRPKAGQRRITASDVARMVGVSRSAVSRAFTPGALIAQSTRDAVRDAAARLGYVPNALARMLISQRSRIVGVVMGTLTNPFRSALLDRLTAELHASFYLPILFPVPPGGTVEEALLSIQQYQPEAVIITGYTPTGEAVRRAVGGGARVVLLNRGTEPDLSADFISCDHEAAGALVAGRMVAAGYRRIAIAGRGPSHVAQLREEGFRAGLKQAGLMPVQAIEVGLTYEGGMAAAARLMLGRGRPDAVFCLSDMTALGFIDAANAARGIVPQRDYGIAGFDDIPMAAWPTYRLSTVAQPIDGLAEQAVAAIRHGAAPSSLLLPGHYVARRSLRDEIDA